MICTYCALDLEVKHCRQLTFKIRNEFPFKLVNSVIDEHRHINDEHLSQLNTILDSFRLD